jgi:hypothetical protein
MDSVSARYIIDKILAVDVVDIDLVKEIIATHQGTEFCIKFNNHKIIVLETMRQDPVHTFLNNSLLNLASLSGAKAVKVKIEDFSMSDLNSNGKNLVFLNEHGGVQHDGIHTATAQLKKVLEYDNVKIINTSCYGSYATDDIYKNLTALGQQGFHVAGLSYRSILVKHLSNAIIDMFFLNEELSIDSYIRCYKQVIEKDYGHKHWHPRLYTPATIEYINDGNAAYAKYFKEDLKSMMLGISFNEHVNVWDNHSSNAWGSLEVDNQNALSYIRRDQK